MNELEQSVLRIIETYQAAVYARDVDALLSLYDQDVVVFDLWGEWVYAGAAAWREMITGWFGSLGSERVIVEVEQAQVMTAEPLAIVHAFVTFRSVSAEGEPLRAMHNRFTWVLKNSEGAWKIVHEHSSAPVDMESFKVILQRQ